MANLRSWLNEQGFDWETGEIVYQGLVHRDHPILDAEFYDGYGTANCPPIVAKDKEAIYFPTQYDGATALERVVLDLEYYTKKGVKTPYPGGG